MWKIIKTACEFADGFLLMECADLIDARITTLVKSNSYACF